MMLPYGKVCNFGCKISSAFRVFDTFQRSRDIQEEILAENSTNLVVEQLVDQGRGVYLIFLADIDQHTVYYLGQRQGAVRQFIHRPAYIFMSVTGGYSYRAVAGSNS